MKKRDVRKMIRQLDDMIAVLDQTLVLEIRTPNERAAAWLLRDARLQLVADLEAKQEGRRDDPA